MKLLVIVLCLLCERFFLQVRSYQHFRWFSLYSQVIEKQLTNGALVSAWVMLVLMILPFVVVASLVLYQVSYLLYGLVGLILNVIILYFCIGPGNPFYPIRDTSVDHHSQAHIGTYLARANEQLFAVLFWYILLGPIAILIYRLIAESRTQTFLCEFSSRLINIIEWLPARMTALLYLLVGNFQAGLGDFTSRLMASPANNQTLLSVCGLDALGSATSSQPLTMPQAESLVEHSVIVLLVFLAFFTLVSWV